MMVMQPPNACEVCHGTHYVADMEKSETNEHGWPVRLVDKPCPKCNPYGMKPKVRY